MIEIEYRLPDGSIQAFVMKHERSAVAVIALTPAHRVVLARQFRPGPAVVVDELPGGCVEPGETFEGAARRELMEETVYESDRWISLGRALECAYRTIHREGFLALDCRRTRAPEPDRTERIEVIEKSIDDFVAPLMRGGSTDGEIEWMGLHRAGLIATVPPRTTRPDSRGSALRLGRA